MAILKSFSIAGLKIWFYSNDHEPPHFHARRKGEWEVRVFFLENRSKMLEIVWFAQKKQILKSDRDELTAMAEKHRWDILKEMDKKRMPQ